MIRKRLFNSVLDLVSSFRMRSRGRRLSRGVGSSYRSVRFGPCRQRRICPASPPRQAPEVQLQVIPDEVSPQDGYFLFCVVVACALFSYVPLRYLSERTPSPFPVRQDRWSDH